MATNLGNYNLPQVPGLNMTGMGNWGAPAPQSNYQSPSVGGFLDSMDSANWGDWGGGGGNQFNNGGANNPGATYNFNSGPNTGALQTGLGVVQGVTGIMDAFLGYKQYRLAQDNFNFQKQAYSTNLENQSRLTNMQLEQQYANRLRGDGTYTPEAVSTYMDQNRLRGS